MDRQPDTQTETCARVFKFCLLKKLHGIIKIQLIGTKDQLMSFLFNKVINDPAHGHIELDSVAVGRKY